MEEKRQRYAEAELNHFKIEKKKKRASSPLFTVSLFESILTFLICYILLLYQLCHDVFWISLTSTAMYEIECNVVAKIENILQANW